MPVWYGTRRSAGRFDPWHTNFLVAPASALVDRAVTSRRPYDGMAGEPPGVSGGPSDRIASRAGAGRDRGFPELVQERLKRAIRPQLDRAAGPRSPAARRRSNPAGGASGMALRRAAANAVTCGSALRSSDRRGLDDLEPEQVCPIPSARQNAGDTLAADGIGPAAVHLRRAAASLAGRFCA